MRDTTRDRFHELIGRATAVFAAKGYRGTKIADVAAALGVSEPAVYRYVESKDALFDQIIRHAASPGAVFEPEALPVPTPPRDATLAFLREALTARSRIAAFERAENGDFDGARDELQAIFGEIYDGAAAYRTGLKIVERSALEWPELAVLWFGELRGGLIERLADYLTRRAAAGTVRAVADPRASARLILEVIAFFAVHRHTDPFPTPVADDVARRTAVEDLVAAFAVD